MDEPLHSRECDVLIEEIDQLNQRFTELPVEQVLHSSQILGPYRRWSSGTLKKGGHQAWEQANLYVSDKVNWGQLPSWDDVVYLNQIISPEHCGVLREDEVWIGNHKACSIEELKKGLKIFRENLLSKGDQENPLIWASRLRYWLVTLHPFYDGNGRTSNLLCDWVLALNGYLPLSHRLKSDAHIGGWSTRSHFSNFEFACFKTLSAILHTYEFVLNQKLK